MRLECGWTKEELAERAGITLATYRRFERTGQVSLERLLWLALVLFTLKDFETVFKRPPGQTLAKLEQRSVRKKGKTT